LEGDRKMDMLDVFKTVADRLPPTELFNLLVFAGVGYGFKVIFSRLTSIMDERAKVSEERNKALININKRFDTYVEEHRHEHNQIENRLSHLQSDMAEIRRDSASVRDSQIRIEAKMDVLLENRRKNERD